MLRNIPNKYTQEMILQQVSLMGLDGKYDFFYLPIDFKVKSHLYDTINAMLAMHLSTWSVLSMFPKSMSNSIIKNGQSSIHKRFVRFVMRESKGLPNFWTISETQVPSRKVRKARTLFTSIRRHHRMKSIHLLSCDLSFLLKIQVHIIII